ncbi:metal ABC transporter permease [candidate division KSB1 bacterium]|nr:metal ABC transporter permease [candidate division KSB1 bacterium]
MLEMFSQPFILSALLVSIVMGLMLSYLGVHVVGRGIVFVDLALGQISMLGVAFASFIEQESFLVSIIFTMIGAFILSLIKIKDKRLKSEAIIGIIYAVASAVTVLFLSKAPHGDADISEVLFGSLFTVTNQQIITMSIIFAVIGLFHFIFRKKIYELTESIEAENARGHSVFDLWNFLFYLSIGLTIVLAVRAGGVIPVFTFLIVPAVSAIFLTHNKVALVLIALAVSVLGSFFGVFFSVHFDFPAGSSIVTMLGFIFFIAAIIRLIRKDYSE